MSRAGCTALESSYTAMHQVAGKVQFASGAAGSPSCRHCNAAPAAELIDGKAIAEDIRKELKAEVEQLKAKYGKVRRAGQGMLIVWCLWIA